MNQNALRTPVVRVLVFLMVLGFASIQARATPFSPKECEFVVDFPSAPTIQTVSAQDGQQFEQAQLFNARYLLRSECFKIDTDAASDETTMKLVRQFAEAQGLLGTEFRSAKTAIGRRITMRGTKSPGGIRATYEAQCTIGLSSMICLTAGGPSDTYPDIAVPRFFQSLHMRFLNAPEPATRALTAQEPEVNVFGFQEDSCGAWTRSKSNEFDRAQYGAWFRGFVSGYNFGTLDHQVPLGRMPDPETLYLYVDKYCRENPLNPFVSAAFSLVKDLRQKSKPSKGRAR